MMNWELFSTVGYVSIALWLCMPLLWLLHLLRRPRRWLCFVALLLGVMAMVLAKVNSRTYVNRIQVDRTRQIEDQLARHEHARRAAQAERAGEVAPIRFAEDDGDDFLDKSGMDQADLQYMQSFDKNATPQWKKQKRKRSANVNDDSLESQIGATETRPGVEPETPREDAAAKPILMSDADKLAADRLDAANLMVIRVMLGLGFLFVVIDYLYRANRYDEAYFPLPLPSSWIDTMTPRDPVAVRPASPRRTLLKELRMFTRRGESYVFMTDDAHTAAQAAVTTYRLPLNLWPVEVLAVADDKAMDDDFVFETLWYCRSSFVVDSPARAEQMLARFLELLAERRATHARTRQTVHIVWDIATPVPQAMLQSFANLGRATGFALFLCRETGHIHPRKQ